MARTNTLRSGNFKMKITTMRRPDGENQYKITLPKEVVEKVRKERLVFAGCINIEKNHAYIEVKEFTEEAK